jgi:hypothetical protein
MTTARYLRLRLHRRPTQPTRRWGDAGEGVISAAIAVLVMAFLGVAMWVGLQGIWETAESNTADQVNEIGQ